MNDHFNFRGEAESFEQLMPMLAIVGSVILAAVIIGMLVKLVAYVFRALPIYTIARRRGLSNPWLAWVPVGQDWILGSVSDQYQYLTRGRNRNKRKVLLILTLTAGILGAVSTAWGFGSVLSYLEAYGAQLPYVAPGELMLSMTGSVLMGVLSFGVGVAAYVFQQISMYDLYRSCDPKNAIPYLVFGILFRILEPVFLMILRSRDGGMPPRRSAPQEPVSEYL